jgi:hypothetical protein
MNHIKEIDESHEGIRIIKMGGGKIVRKEEAKG